MRSVKDRAPAEPAVVHPFNRPCNAFGCPELGTISHSNAGPAPQDSWFCRFHFGRPASEWPEITRHLRVAAEGA